MSTYTAEEIARVADIIAILRKSQQGSAKLYAALVANMRRRIGDREVDIALSQL